jgi:hypothetical protein
MNDHGATSSIRRWPIAALAAGLLLLASAPFLASFVPDRAVWTDADARAYTEAAADLHAKTFSPHDEARTAAQHHFDEMQSRLNAAQNRRNWPKYVALTAGALLTITGVAGYALQR